MVSLHYSVDVLHIKGLTYGSNVTFMTGQFQSSLPHIHDKLIAAANYGFQRNRIDASLDSYGVRSVQYLSFEREGIEEYKANLKMKVKSEKEAKESMFIVHTHESLAEMNRKMNELVDPDADEQVVHFITPNNGNT